MDAPDQTPKVVQDIEKVIGWYRRDIVSAAELVRTFTEGLAHYRRIDLAESLLTRLPTELRSLLQEWADKVLQPGYQYQWSGFGVSPPDEYNVRMQAELISLASHIRRTHPA